jgi:hypothetical protein
LFSHPFITISRIFEVEDTKGVIRVRISKKNIQHNGQKEKVQKGKQALEYRINCEIYTPYAGAAGMFLHINGKFSMGKLKSSLVSQCVSS